MEDDAFVDFIHARVQRRRSTNVEIEYFGSGLVPYGEKITEASGDEQSNLNDE